MAMASRMAAGFLRATAAEINSPSPEPAGVQLQLQLPGSETPAEVCPQGPAGRWLASWPGNISSVAVQDEYALGGTS